MRLSDHLLHEWDVAVVLDLAATLADDGTEIVVDNLELIAGYASKPVGLAPEHTPATVTGDTAVLDRLRQVFPGF